jgi:hypothetical protein
MASFDYSSLLPGKLEPALQALTNVYGDNVDRLNKAYLQTPLPGVYTSARTYSFLISKDVLYADLNYLASGHNRC